MYMTHNYIDTRAFMYEVEKIKKNTQPACMKNKNKKILKMHEIKVYVNGGNEHYDACG